MHATHLAQLAGTFASVGHAITADSVQMLGDAAHGYWLASRFRCDAWHERISAHRSAIENCGTSQRARLWRIILPTLQEILISEPLSRTLAYLACYLERRAADTDWGALGDNVLGSHSEARQRCLNLMVFGYGLPVEGAVSLNRLRRLMEFYSDQLIGSLPSQVDLDHYAFDSVLVAQTQRDFRRYSVIGIEPQVRLMTISSTLMQLLNHDHEAQSANPVLNSNIAESAIGMLPAALFDSFGLPQGRIHHALNQWPHADTPLTPRHFHRPLPRF